jgi:hypothetical protein
MAMLNHIEITQDEELVQLARLHQTTSANQLGISTEPHSNLILIVGKGLWTSAILAAHFREMGGILLAKRERFATTRVLCDTRDQAEQTQAMLNEMREGAMLIYKPTDRVATVAGSSLIKRRFRQEFSHPNAEYFVSVETAKMWLDAYR